MNSAVLVGYLMRFAQERYYPGALEEPGRWDGRGAEQLGLRGRVLREHFHHLLLGLSPDGQTKLVQNAGKPSRQSGWDLTFSAPKSASVLWATLPKRKRRAIEKAHQATVRKCLAHIERNAGITRRGRGGAIKERAALTWATFQHGSSRANDPNLHTHAVLVNVGLRRDGTAGALQSRDFFRLKMEVGALYQKELAGQLHSRLGLEMEPAKVGYRIKEMPQTLCRTFSKRRQSIEKSMARRGEHGAVAAKEAALRTRQRKESVSRAQLFAAWQEEAAAQGWTKADALKLIHPTHDQRREHISAGPHPQKAVEPAVSPEREASRPVSRREQPIASEKAPATHPLPLREERPPVSSSGRIAGQCVASKVSSRGQTQELPQAGAPSHCPQSARKDPPHSIPTGFESYPDFVGPPAPSKKSEKRKATLSQINSKRSIGRQQEQLGLRRSATEGARRGSPQRVTPTRQRWQQPMTARTPRSRLSHRVWSRAQRAARGLLQVGWQPIFPKAPAWSPAKKWKAPVLVLDRQRPPAQQPRKWGRVVWSQDLVVGEVRVQQRRLFPKAPAWSPARKLTLPVVRVVTHPPPSHHQQTLSRSY